MTETLIETAKQAGLTDLDLLKLARPNVPPAVAVVDLQQRFPGAFPTQGKKRGQDMTPEELKAGMQRMNDDAFRKNCKQLDDAALAKFRKQFGMKG